MRADPCVSSNTPRLVQVESWVTPVRFSREGGAVSVMGAQTLTHGSRPVLTEWGNKPSRHTSADKYTSKAYMLGVNHQ